MAFPLSIIRKAWYRQDGHCAYCGKLLVPENRDGGERGAWHAHHRNPVSHGGSDSLINCVILCINEPESCHWKIGHGGRSWDYYAPLPEELLLWLYVR